MRIPLRIQAICAAAWIIVGGMTAAVAQTMPAVPGAAVTRPAEANGKLGFGTDGLSIPPAILKNATSPRTVQLLGEALEREASEPRRAELIYELGLTGQPSAVPLLRRGLSSPDSATRAEAAKAVALLGNVGESLTTDVAKLVDDKDPAVRRDALLSYAQLADEASASQALAKALEDLDSLVVAAALSRATTAHAAVIAQRLTHWPLPLQVRAIQALGRTGARDQAPALAALLNNDSIPLRAGALTALARLQATDQAQAVLARLHDPHPTVRREAMAALANVLTDRKLRQARAIEALSNDSDPTVREAAVRLLSKLTAQSVALLVKQLNDPYRPLHDAAREALVVRVSDDVRETVIEAAVKLLDDPSLARRADGSYLLGKLRSSAAIEKHAALMILPKEDLHNADVWTVAGQAAASAGLIGDARAEAQVMELSKLSTLLDVRMDTPPDKLLPQEAPAAVSNALVAAGLLGHRPIIPVAEQVLTGDARFQSDLLRSAAVWVIGYLESGSPALGHRLMGIYRSEFEHDAGRFEALKAIGNLRVASLAGELAEIAGVVESDKAAYSPDERWMAHWSLGRINGRVTAYIPPTHPFTPELSIMDMPH